MQIKMQIVVDNSTEHVHSKVVMLCPLLDMYLYLGVQEGGCCIKEHCETSHLGNGGPASYHTICKPSYYF